MIKSLWLAIPTACLLLVLLNGSTALAGSNIEAGVWSTTGSLHDARTVHTATLLNNGQVLVVGGLNISGITAAPLASAELYNPSTQAWSATGSLHTARTAHTATLLSNGQVLVAGGAGVNFTRMASAELYNPSTNMWSATGSLHDARNAHTATLLNNGQVLVVGGLGTTSTSLASAELYD